MNNIDINDLDMAHEDGKTIIVLSPNHDQSPMNSDNFREKVKEMFRDVYRFNKQGIYLKNGSTIRFVSILSSALRGIYPDRLIIVNEHKMDNSRLLRTIHPIMREKPDIKKWVW